MVERAENLTLRQQWYVQQSKKQRPGLCWEDRLYGETI